MLSNCLPDQALSVSLQQRCDPFKAFLGLHLALNTVHFRANADGTVTRGRPPFRPQNVGADGSNNLFAPSDSIIKPPVVPPPPFVSALEQERCADAAASATEKAAALELIRQRRADKVQKMAPAVDRVTAVDQVLPLVVVPCESR